MSDACTVTFEGDHGGEYITSCATVQYIDDHLRNIGNTSIYLYPTFRSGTDQDYILIAMDSWPQWIDHNSYQNRPYIMNASNIQYNAMSYIYRDYMYVNFFIWFVLAVSAVMHIVKRG